MGSIVDAGNFKFLENYPKIVLKRNIIAVNGVHKNVIFSPPLNMYITIRSFHPSREKMRDDTGKFPSEEGFSAEGWPLPTSDQGKEPSEAVTCSSAKSGLTNETQVLTVSGYEFRSLERIELSIFWLSKFKICRILKVLGFLLKKIFAKENFFMMLIFL